MVHGAVRHRMTPGLVRGDPLDHSNGTLTQFTEKIIIIRKH